MGTVVIVILVILGILLLAFLFGTGILGAIIEGLSDSDWGSGGGSSSGGSSDGGGYGGDSGGGGSSSDW